jgi:predicted Zn finger-like uncharacterized protein
MYTRCPACHAVHAVNAAALAASSGRYRCAKCSKVSNAIECLFDELPSAGDRPPGAGELPVLGMPIDLEAASRARREPPDGDGAEEASENAGEGGSFRWLVRAAWISIAVAVVGFSVVRLAEFTGRPLLDREGAVEPASERQGAGQPYRDLDRIHLVSRELRDHPTQPGRLRLSATIVNRAERNQPYPVIEVALQDVAGRTLLTRRLEPSDYLDTDRAAAGMAPGAYTPILVDLDDPGEQAVGFELEFR